MKNKKGDLSDGMTLTFWIFFFAVGLIVLVYVFLQIYSPLQETIIGQNAAANSTLNSAITYTQTAIPSSMLIIFFGLLLSLFISAFFVRTHPVFIPLYLIFGAISIIIAVALGNAWGSISSFQQFQDTINLNTTTRIIGFLMNNLVKIQVIAFFISLIILFAKPSQQGAGGEPY